jgi:hypothetical protein
LNGKVGMYTKAVFCRTIDMDLARCDGLTVRSIKACGFKEFNKVLE